MITSMYINDNSGLGPIIVDYLSSGSTRGQIMVLVINELGDHQMETYFDISSEVGGMFCQEEYNEWDKLFDKIKVTNRQSVQEVGGEYIPQKNESIGAIRVAQNAFFKLCDTIENIFVSHS